MSDAQKSLETPRKVSTSLDHRVARTTRFLFACILINTVALLAMFSVQASVLGPRSDRTFDAMNLIRANEVNALSVRLAIDTWLRTNSADDLDLVKGARQRLELRSAVVEALNPDSSQTTRLLGDMKRAEDRWVSTVIDTALDECATFVPGTPKHEALVQANEAMCDAQLQLYLRTIVGLTDLTQTISRDQRRVLNATIIFCGVLSLAGAAVGIYRGRKLRASVSPPLAALVDQTSAIENARRQRSGVRQRQTQPNFRNLVLG